MFGIQQWCIGRFVGTQFVEWSDWKDYHRDTDRTTDEQVQELGCAQDSDQRGQDEFGLDAQNWGVFMRVLTPSAPVAI